MKNCLRNVFADPFRTILFALAVTGTLTLRPAFGGNGTPEYLDNNGTTGTPPFGAPLSGTFADNATVWSTSSAGTAATTAFPTSSQMTFGAASGDSTASGTYTVSFANGNNYNGFVVNSTAAFITLSGSANAHFNSSAMVVNVASGSSLIWNITRSNGGNLGFNMNFKDLTFTGSGTNTFITHMGCNDNASINLNGPTLNLAYTATVGSTPANPFSGPFTLTSGTLNFQTAQSSDAFSLMTPGSSSTNFTINGGTIDNASGSTMTLSVGGGYKFGGNFTFSGSSSLNLGSPAVSLTTTPQITVGANTLTIPGAINDGGNGFGITKAGSGTLTLNGANSYTGGTLVNSGKLITTTASTGGGNYVTADNTTLVVKIAGAGQQLNMNDLTLGSSSGCTLEIDAGTLGNPTATVINMAGFLSLNGTVNLKLSGTGFTGGTFNILSSPHSGSFTLVASPRLNATLNDNGTTVSITLNNPDSSIVWDGTASGNWNINSAVNTWKGNNSSTATDYEESGTYGNDSVQFTDAATGTTTVNVTTTITPASLVINNTSKNYTLNGSGKITGTAALAKSGTGTLTIDNSTANDFSGGTTISAGTVQLGNNDANGTLGSGGIVHNGALVYKRTDDFTVANAISGSGSITNNGSGTNRFTGVNSYTGTMLISAGEVVANNASLGNGSLGNFAGAVYITNGATLDVENGTANALSFTNTTDNGGKQFYIAGTGVGGNGAIVNNGTANQQNAFQRITLTANATVGGPARWDMRVPDGKFSPILDFGGFTLTKTGTNQMSMVGLQLINGGNLVINNGVFSLETSSTNSGTPVTVNAGGKLGHFRQWGGIFTAPVTLNGGAITNITGNNGGCTNDAPITLTADSFLGGTTGTNSPLYINGAIGQSGGSYGVTVANGGNGTGASGARLGGVLLAGNNTYSGNTAVRLGFLYLTNTGSIANSARIIVDSAAMLDVSGLVSTFTLSSGQILSNSTSTASLDGNINTGSGKLGLLFASGTPSFTEINGTLTLSSGTTVFVNNTGSALTAGSYKVVSAGAGGSVAGTAPSSVTVGGNGLAAGLAASAQITGNELYVVVASSSPPRLARINISGTTLTIVATNGTSGAQWTLLQSTNLAIPFSQWQTNTVLTFTTDGGITNTANVATNAQTYYILKQ